MPRLRRTLLLTFIESFATILIERGIYFYTHGRLGFSEVENLVLALGFGGAYVAGALASHGAAVRFGEKRILLATLLGQIGVHLLLSAYPASAVVVAGTVVLGFVIGMKWPVVESYVSAGRTPAATVRSVGGFNLAWSGAVPLALAAAGPLIASWSPSLFLLAAAGSAAGVVLAWPFPARPVHLPEDHPERLGPGEHRRWTSLLVSARWSLLASYSMMWVLAALMPAIFSGLGFSVAAATGLSAVLDVVRFATFAGLQVWTGWRGRRGPLAVVILGLPAGFFMVLFGPSLAVILGGEVLFGVAIGMTYYAALYYAMVVKSASVDAGGGHEGLIGGGFAIGPAAGLLGRGLAPVLGSVTLGMIAGLGTLIAACGAGALRALAATHPPGDEPPASDETGADDEPLT